MAIFLKINSQKKGRENGISRQVCLAAVAIAPDRPKDSLKCF